MIRRFEDWTRGETVDCDVVVVGTGAGGAAAGATLAQAGLRTVLLEEGRLWRPEQFKPRAMWAYRNLYAERAARIVEGDSYIPLPAGRGVGGSTLVNSAICFRAPDFVLEEWVREHGLDGLAPRLLAPVFDEVERIIGVAKTHPSQARGNNLTFKRGADALGWTGDFISRNAPGCVGCGVCQLGCPIGGKGSVDLNYIPAALQAGAALYTDARVERVLLSRGRAVGVEASILEPESEEPRFGLRVRAAHVVLAGGPIGTPLVLMRTRAGNSSGWLGKNLHIHPGTATAALMPEVVNMWDGVTQGYYVHNDPDVILETFTATPELFFALTRRGDLPPQSYKHLAAAGALIRDESEGVVEPGRGHRARISYRVVDRDKERYARGLRMVVETFFAAGAAAVRPGLEGQPFVESRAEAMRLLQSVPLDRLFLYASHPNGTCRMGADPRRSVVSPTGELHGVRGLWIADASLFPSALGVNPQVTVMALATIVARNLLSSAAP